MEESLPFGINIETLKKELNELRNTPFPNFPKDKRLADIGIELDLYDTHIAGIVSSFISGNKVDKKKIYIDEAINDKLQSYFPMDIDSRIIQEKLIDRKNKLDTLVKMVLELYDKD